MRSSADSTLSAKPVEASLSNRWGRQENGEVTIKC
jgi:hypothetical protein